jgi:hypothetical protein
MGEVFCMDEMIVAPQPILLGPAAKLPRRGCSIWLVARMGTTAAGMVRATSTPTRRDHMVALIVLLLLLALLGGLGFAAHVLWYILIIAVVLWLIGFFIGGAADAGGRRGWYRW